VKNLNVAVIGDMELPAALGKRGTESDIALFNFKREDVALTLIAPSRYPGKLRSLLYCMTMAEYAIVVVKELNAVLGEILVALDSWGLRRGCFIMENYITPGQLGPLVAGTALEDYEFVERDPVALRERLLDIAVELDASRAAEGRKEGAPVIPVDHFFNVKGIGLVILGCVARGAVKRHDKLRVFPTGKTCTVRSIQTHDRDVVEACAGDRVGLALKGIEYSDMDRGFVLSSDETLRSVEGTRLRVRTSPYWKGKIGEGTVLHLCTGMQLISSTVTGVDAGDGGDEVKEEGVGTGGAGRNAIVSVKLERAMVLEDDSRIFVTQLEGGDLRIVGTATAWPVQMAQPDSTVEL